MTYALLLCTVALVGGVRSLPDAPAAAVRGDPGRAVVDVQVVAVDQARGLVAAKQRLADGRVLLTVVDVARDQPYYTGLVVDDDDLVRALSDVRMTRGTFLQVDAQFDADRDVARVPVPTADGSVEVTVDVRPPTPAEFASDPRIDAWRAARVVADQPYASTEILLVLFTVSGRIVASDVYEAPSRSAVELTVPKAFVDRGVVVFLERARAGPAHEAFSFSSPVDLEDALARLDELPKNEPLVLAGGGAGSVSAVPPPDQPTETREPDVAETICCGLPVFGGLCAGLWCMKTCENAFKTRR